MINKNILQSLVHELNINNIFLIGSTDLRSVLCFCRCCKIPLNFPRQYKPFYQHSTKPSNKVTLPLHVIDSIILNILRGILWSREIHLNYINDSHLRLNIHIINCPTFALQQIENILKLSYKYLYGFLWIFHRIRGGSLAFVFHRISGSNVASFDGSKDFHQFFY